MMPGSIHPNGDEIRWANRASPKVVSLPMLQQRCNFLAAAVLAARYIWLDGERHESVMQISAIFHALKYPLSDALNFIAALISISAGTKDPAHAATVHTTYNRLDADKPTRGGVSLRRRFSSTNPDMIRRFLQLLGYSNLWLDDFNDKYACVLVGGKYKIAITSPIPGDAIKYIGVEDFKHYTAGQVLKVQARNKNGEILEGIVKEIPIAELWLKHQDRRQYSEVTFLPGVLQAACPPEREHQLNEWTGWAVQPLDNSPEKCKSFRTYVEQYLTDPRKPEQARWVYTYFAHMLRHPLDKQRAAVVIIGPQKIGKSVFVNYFGRILGDSHINVADAAKIHGRFNYH